MTPLEDDCDKGITRGKYFMSHTDVAAVFDPVVQDVITLVLGQINAVKAPVSKILLVGGFGQSAYLRERIREAAGEVEVLQPGNGSVYCYLIYSPRTLTSAVV